MARPRLVPIDEITKGLQRSVIMRRAAALRLADRYSVLKRGEIVAEGDTAAADAEETIHAHLRV